MSWLLNAIEPWARGQGYYLEREIGSVLEAKAGRLDGLLVPVDWNAQIRKKFRAFALVGIECKASRPDFLRGKKIGQFERYRDDAAIAGLYVATFQGVCKTSELPDGVGHLVISKKSHAVICRRQPAYRDTETPVRALWNVLCRMNAAHHTERCDQEQRHKEKTRELGNAARDTIFEGIRRFEERLRN